MHILKFQCDVPDAAVVAISENVQSPIQWPVQSHKLIILMMMRHRIPCQVNHQQVGLKPANANINNFLIYHMPLTLNL